MATAAPLSAVRTPEAEPDLVEQVKYQLATLDRVGSGLAKLKADYTGLVFDVKSPQGMKDAKVARAAIREPRFEVERIRKEAKAPILALGRRIDSEAQRIIAAVREVEKPIDDQITAEEQRIERERQEAVAREMARAAAITARIRDIRDLPLRAVGKTSAQLASLNQQLNVLGTGFDFMEFAAQRDEAFNAAGGTLATLYRETLRQEEEAEQQRQRRIELERLHQEQAERDRLAREEQERRQRALDEREAEIHRKEEQQRERETAPPAPEPLIIPALTEAYVAPAVPTEAIQPAPAMALSLRPTEEELIVAVAMHFSVSRETALAWLRDAQFGDVQ